MIEEFRPIAEELCQLELVDVLSGNLSVRQGDKILITGRGVRLSALTEKDLVEVPIGGVGEDDKKASTELPVHRAIYQATETRAILHAHPLHAIALSLTEGKIVPVDRLGQALFRSAPIVRVREVVGSEEVASLLPPIFSSGYVIAVVRSHGSFAIGQSLEEAFRSTVALEHSCKILVIQKQLGSQRPPASPQRRDFQPRRDYPPRSDQRVGIPPGIGVMDRHREHRRPRTPPHGSV